MCPQIKNCHILSTDKYLRNLALPMYVLIVIDYGILIYYDFNFNDTLALTPDIT